MTLVLMVRDLDRAAARLPAAARQPIRRVTMYGRDAKAMTVAVIIAGLAPLMWSSGTGAEIMQRIAAPMIGGMITAPLTLLLGIAGIVQLVRHEGRASALVGERQ